GLCYPELHFEDCRVPAENMLPNIRGLRGPLSCLDEARYGIAWGATGAARACYEVALDYAKTRIQFNRPIGSFQLVQQKLAIMATELVKAQLLALQLGRNKMRESCIQCRFRLRSAIMCVRRLKLRARLAPYWELMVLLLNIRLVGIRITWSRSSHMRVLTISTHL